MGTIHILFMFLAFAIPTAVVAGVIDERKCQGDPPPVLIVMVMAAVVAIMAIVGVCAGDIT